MTLACPVLCFPLLAVWWPTKRWVKRVGYEYDPGYSGGPQPGQWRIAVVCRCTAAKEWYGTAPPHRVAPNAEQFECYSILPR